MDPAYRELLPPGPLRPAVACVWEQQPPADVRHRVIPDGCVDLIWLGGRELVIAGPDTGPRVVSLAAGARTSGIRLRPGAAGSLLGRPASELRDLTVPAALVWGDAEAGQLAEALLPAPAAARLRLLAGAVARRRVVVDPLVAGAARALARTDARIGDVAAALGLSERQLHRRTVAAVGYGPKMLARVARLRRLVASGDQELARRALAAGYSSQAHMNEDVRRLTGTTPVRFLKDATLTAA